MPKTTNKTKKRAGVRFTPHYLLIKSRVGFTLIETIVYIALFGLIMGGTLTVVFQLLQSDTSLNSKTYIQGEANFVLRKVNWALTGVDPAQASTPSAGSPTSNLLNVIKYGGLPNGVEFQMNGDKIEMREGGTGPFLPITTDNVSVSSLQFTYLTSPLPGFKAVVVINGLTFETTKYLRQ